MSDDVVLKRFVFNTEKTPHPTMLAIGKRMAGKSNLSTNIASQYDCDRWMAWCGTKDTQNFWAARFGGAKVCTYGSKEEDIKKLEDTVKEQELIVERYERKGEKPPRRYTIGFIFDDVTADEGFSKSQIIKDLFSNGRHYLAIVLICVQFITQVPPQVRGNTDFLFMLHNTKMNISILYREYISCDLTPKQFASLLKFVTSQSDSKGKKLYNALVFDNTVAKDRLDEIFYVHRSPPDFNPKNVLLGSAEWREEMSKYRTQKQHEIERIERRKARQKMCQRIQDERRMQAGSGERHVTNYEDDDVWSMGSDEDPDTYEVNQRGGDSYKIILKKKLSDEHGKKAERRPTSVAARKEYADYRDPFGSRPQSEIGGGRRSAVGGYSRDQTRRSDHRRSTQKSGGYNFL